MKLKSVPRFISLGVLLVASGLMVGLWSVPATGDTYNCEKIPRETIQQRDADNIAELEANNENTDSYTKQLKQYDDYFDVNSPVPADQVFGGDTEDTEDTTHLQHDGCPKWYQPTKAHTPKTPEFSTAVNTLWNFFRTMIAFSAIWFIFNTFRNKEGKDETGFAPYKIFKIILGATVALALTSTAGIDWIANLYNMSDQVVTGGTIASGDNQFTDIIEGSRQNLNLGLSSDPTPESGQTATGTTTTTLPPRDPTIHWWVNRMLDDRYYVWFYYEQPDTGITSKIKIKATNGRTIKNAHIEPNRGYFMNFEKKDNITVTVTGMRSAMTVITATGSSEPLWVQSLITAVGTIIDDPDDWLSKKTHRKLTLSSPISRDNLP